MPYWISDSWLPDMLCILLARYFYPIFYTELGDYRFQSENVNPDDEALYGPAPKPVQADPGTNARHGSASGLLLNMCPVNYSFSQKQSKLHS